MNCPKIWAAIIVSFSIVISSAAIANFIGHQLYPVETPKNL